MSFSLDNGSLSDEVTDLQDKHIITRKNKAMIFIIFMETWSFLGSAILLEHETKFFGKVSALPFAH